MTTDHTRQPSAWECIGAFLIVPIVIAAPFVAAFIGLCWLIRAVF